MNAKKRIIGFAVVVALLTSLLSGCAATAQQPANVMAEESCLKDVQNLQRRFSSKPLSVMSESNVLDRFERYESCLTSAAADCAVQRNELYATIQLLHAQAMVVQGRANANTAMVRALCQ